MSGLSGQRPIADSSPMDKDYNGGRWDVKIVVFTAAGMAAHDPDGDGMVNFEIKDDATLLDHASRLGHFTIMDANVYFECPLIP